MEFFDIAELRRLSTEKQDFVLGERDAGRLIDVTGAELKPGDPEHCQGNGEDPRFECCCDECNYLQQCFPEEKE